MSYFGQSQPTAMAITITTVSQTSMNSGRHQSTNSASTTRGCVSKVPRLGGCHTDLPYYTNGQSVTLTAFPDVGDTFFSWGGAITGSANSVILVMNSNMSVTASFGVLAKVWPWIIDLGLDDRRRCGMVGPAGFSHEPSRPAKRPHIR